MDKGSQDLVKKLSLLVVIVLLVGTVFYHFQENLTWIDAFYFSVVSLTTVGYGDISPTTEFGKLFTTIYIISGIGIFGMFINGVGKRRVDKAANRQKVDDEKKSKEASK